jgi:hypothetical protein
MDAEKTEYLLYRVTDYLDGGRNLLKSLRRDADRK